MKKAAILAGAMFMAAGLGAGGSAWAQPAARPLLDPACMQAAPWEVDATQGPIRVFGCRPGAKVPAPDAQGWVQFDRPKAKDGADAGWIRVKLDKAAADGTLTFEVQDNGGGSGVFPYRVTGKPGPKGVLAKQGLKVVGLPAK